MNYIELINNFWSVRRIRPMTSYEADFYFYLLKECNSRNWTNPFELPSRNVELELGISRKTICDLRNKLQQKGLISFKGTATSANDDLSNAYVYPNPVRPEYQGTVKIAGLVDNATIKITDIGGNLVYETTSQGGTIEWDTTAFGKYKVASGVYMIFISAEDGVETKVKKVMIIR